MRRPTRDPAGLIPPKYPTYQVLLPLGDPARRHDQRTRFGRAVARAESGRLRTLLDAARAQNMFGGPK